MSKSELPMLEPLERVRWGLRGDAALALWGGADPENEDSFNEWYTHEHLPERIAIPGFLRARRYVSCTEQTAARTYFTLYEVRSRDVLVSDAYLGKLNSPTRRTLIHLPQFKAMRRTACRITHSVARGEGGSLVLMEFGPAPGQEEHLRAWIARSLAPEWMRRNGTLAVHLCEADATATAIAAEVESYRNVPTSAGRWLILVEGAWIDLSSAFEIHVRDLDELARQGTAPETSCTIFRLLGSLAAESVDGPANAATVTAQPAS